MDKENISHFLFQKTSGLDYFLHKTTSVWLSGPLQTTSRGLIVNLIEITYSFDKLAVIVWGRKANGVLAYLAAQHQNWQPEQAAENSAQGKPVGRR